MILSSWGAAWGTWRAGLGVCHMGVDHPKGVIKNIVPIVMAGVLGIYGLIVSVIITQSISSPGNGGYNTYSVYNGYTHVSPFTRFDSAPVALFVSLISFHSAARRGTLLWPLMLGCWGNNRCHWRCWSESVWCQSRARSKVVLGRVGRRWRWRFRIRCCKCGGSFKQAIRRHAYHAHFF